MSERILRIHKPLLALGDALLTILAFYVAWYVRYELEWYRSVDPASYTDFDFYLWVSFLAAIMIVGAYYIEGVYRLPRGVGLFTEFWRLFNGVAAVTIVLMMGNFLLQPPYHSRLVYGIAGMLILLFVSLARILNRAVLARLRRRGIGAKRVLLVGAGEVSRMVMRVLLANANLGYQIVGFLDDNPDRGERNLGPFQALGAIDNLSQILSERRVDEVIVTLPWQYHRRIISVLNQCERNHVQAKVVPDVLQISLDQVDLETLKGIPLLGVKQGAIAGPRLAIKRGFDLLIILPALLLLLPIMLLLALIIRLDSPGPILFVQERIGRNGRPFAAFKFRTMVADAEDLRPHLQELNEADGPLFKIKNDPRRTRVGSRLRRFSLDELPQIFNVLRGEMSLVGPRPALPEEVAAYEPWHRKRLEVLPGLTGLWQISGRSDLSFAEMVLLDVYYVENWSPWLDLSILLRTIPKVLIGEGAY